MRLWFENSAGERRVIANCKNWKEINRAIDNFVAEANARKPAGVRPFRIHYIRSQDVGDNLVQLDVGSHTEFFYWEGKNAELMSEIMKGAEI